MYPAIPLEIESIFIQDAAYLDIVRYSHVCRQARAVVQALLSLRCLELLLPYFDAEDIRRFWNALDKGHGGITGSGALWMTKAYPTWVPDDLNTVVTMDRATPIRFFLQDCGWRERSISVRVPAVLQARGHHRLRAYPLTDNGNYTNLTWIYTKAAKRTITVTETADSSVFKHIAEARHTMATMLVTSSTIISLHGFECAASIATWRAGWDRRTHEHVDAAQRVLLMGGTDSYFTAISGECGSRCPGVVRRLRGGTGVGLLAWRAFPLQGPLSDQETANDADEEGLVPINDELVPVGPDVVSRDAYNGFIRDRYAFGWSWCHCRNEACATFMFPRDLLPTVPVGQTLSSNPKVNSILRTQHAVEHCVPPFAHLYSGLLFPTACRRPYAVSVPLDHGLRSYRTMDDLRVHTWIKPRIAGLPALPSVMPPSCVVGSTTIFNALAWKELYQPECYLLVFMTSIHQIGPINEVLVPPLDGGRPVHGDVLLMLEHRSGLVNLTLDSADAVASIFYDAWKTKVDGQPMGTYYQTSF
ncbi:hypothetical protein B0H13DRAFT_2371259 [Mycena leptocephala]|nr:hypothetical protein B0H13DRAFT_2371259 [Mycena leptocephala]